MPEKKPGDNGTGWNIMIPGIVLIVIGILFLVKNSYWWFDMGDLWPILLIVIGILMLIKHGKKNKTENKIEDPPSRGEGASE